MPGGVYILICAVCALTGCVGASAEEALEARFRDPPADDCRLSLALPLERLSPESEALSRQLVQFRALGAGGLLVRVPAADDAVWARLSVLADACRRLGLELGVCDFALSAEEEKSRSRTQRLLWTSEAGETASATNRALSVFREDASYRTLARLAVPVQGGVSSLQVMELEDETPFSSNGVWRVYRFGCSDVEPPLADCFDGKDVFRHVNNLLFACQSRLTRSYGTTLAWCQMRGPGRNDLIWPRDLPALFLRQSGLGLMHQLPSLAGTPVGGESTAVYVRRQVGRTVREAWRERFAVNVNDLVHEAGLEAGIDVDDVPMDAEEVALYFRRPTFSAARTPSQRERNIHAAGGARVTGRRFVVGHLDGGTLPDETAAHAAGPFIGRGEADALFADGATRLLMEVSGEIPEEGARFAQVSGLCRYAHRCQELLQTGEAVADVLVWSSETPRALDEYACDFANQAMIASAVAENGVLRFDSERAYSNVVVTAEVVREKTSEKRIRQLLAGGVAVWLLACGQPDEEDVFEHLPIGGNCRRWGAAGETLPVPDVQWETDVSGVQMRFLHRRTTGADIYYGVNGGASGGTVSCVFRDCGRGVPECWNPVSGETRVSAPATRLSDGRCRVALPLGPRDAVFVVFKR